MLKIAWSPLYAHPLPPEHRFPMVKYELLPEQLLYEGTITASNLFEPPLLEEEHILSTHEKSYWEKLKHGQLNASEIRRTGFPFSAALVEREMAVTSGTLQSACYALEHGISMNIAGGTHHAFPDKGEGFCLLNDIAISANYLLRHHLARRILVVDLDVHQGNGTAAIFGKQHQVFTFSIHGEKNFPLHKERSHLDIALPDHTNDNGYLNQLKTHLPHLLDRFEPDFIFYQAGVDVLGSDKLGRLDLSLQGCKERDRFVIATCKANAIPLAISMGGGYSEKMSDILEAHMATFRLAQEIFF